MFFGWSGDNFVREVIEPPQPIPYFKYNCGKKFFLEPLVDMAKSKDLYGLITLDLSETTIGMLDGKTIKIISHIESLVPNKHNKGGQSSVRFERLRDIAINEYYKKIADKCTEIFLNKDINGLIIGGPALTKDDFIDGCYLHHELRKKIIGIVNTSYTDESGLRELVKSSESIIRDLDYLKEENILNRFWKELRNDGKYVYGESTMIALNNGIVDTLIVDEGKVTEELIKACEANNTKLLGVSRETESGQMFCQTFIIGAILRYAP